MRKRVALIGNMNNNFFAITRYLRDVGYDAHLFYRFGMEHFQPVADTYTNDYIEYTHQVNWVDRGFHKADLNDIRASLNGFTYYIGQGDEAAAAYKAGFVMDVYYPYGSDVYKYSYLPQEYSPIKKLRALLGLYRDITYREMLEGTGAKYIRGVISTARNVAVLKTNSEFENKLAGLELQGTYHNVGMPFIYTPQYETDEFLSSNSNKLFENMRASHDFIVLYHGRQEWRTYHNDFTQKNTHHLIQGFANFVKTQNPAGALLVMLEYGSDTEHSKKLIAELGIEDYVKWFPTMYRKDLMRLIYNVDVCTGEFDKSYLMFGTLAEALTLKKPVIHHRQDELYKSDYPELYPILNAKTPEEISASLSFAFANKEKVRQVGEDAHEWFMEHFITSGLRELKQLIEH
jgi:glycosyltransferase involved in cell wall biosynthesis